MTTIVLRDIVKSFFSREGSECRALDGASFDAAPANITCIVGPTGSGKSTLLRIISGLERPDRGSVLINGAPPAEQRGIIGYLAQRHTLLPWMRVRENIGLPLALRNMPDRELQSRVNELCGALGLSGAEDRYPYELSGGMQQRAALGRLLATDSRLWLLDEPFTALDERTRHQLQQLLVQLVGNGGLSVLFVTHSIDEAVFLADRVIVLSAAPGNVVEILDIAMPRPRNRLSSEYGMLMERIRTRIESVL